MASLFVAQFPALSGPASKNTPAMRCVWLSATRIEVDFISGQTLELAENSGSEGYELQLVRKCFATNPALAAEGRFPSKQHFFRKLFSRAAND